MIVVVRLLYLFDDTCILHEYFSIIVRSLSKNRAKIFFEWPASAFASHLLKILRCQITSEFSVKNDAKLKVLLVAEINKSSENLLEYMNIFFISLLSETVITSAVINALYS